MKKKFIWIFVVFITFIIGSSFVSIFFYQTYLQDLKTPEEIVSEKSVNVFKQEKILEVEQKIYSIVLKEKYLDETASTLAIAQNIVCIEDQDKLRGSIIDKYNSLHLNSFNSLQKSTRENFLGQSANCGRFNQKFDISNEHFFVKDASEISSVSRSLISLSNIGFNMQITQAVLYVGRWCGPKCGEGNYYLLNKIDGKWLITEEINSWVS